MPLSHRPTNAFARRIWRSRFSPVAKVVLVLGIGFHVFTFLFLRIVPEKPPSPRPADYFVAYLGSGTGNMSQVLREHSLLFDPEPLIMPTAWNAASAMEVPVGQQGKVSPEILDGFPPILDLGAYRGSGHGYTSGDLPLDVATARDLLAPPYWSYFSREPTVPTNMPEFRRTPGLWVLESLMSPGEQRSGNWPERFLQRVPDLFEPAIYEVVIREGSVVGTSFVVRSPETEGVRELVDTLLVTPRIFAKLPDGVYRLTVEP